MFKKLIFTLTILAMLVGACAPKEPSQSQTPKESQEPRLLNVMTHDSFDITAELLEKFESENNVKVNIIKAGDTGSALNRLILTKTAGAQEADVFYGIDNTFLSRALENDLFEAYDAPALAKIDAGFKLDPANGALPVDYGDVCINYDKAWFADKAIELPNSLEALTDPAYKNLLIVENPSTSSPGLAFMLATIAHFGEDAWLDYWKELKNNTVVISSDWETAYYSHFSGSSGKGPQPMVVSYSSSPAAEFIYAELELEESPTASIVADDACWRQIEFAGIVKGTRQRDLAEKFIDFLLSKDFQEDLPMQMFVFPVLSEAVLPDDFVKNSQIPENPATLNPADIAQNREKWIEQWLELMLGH